MKKAANNTGKPFVKWVGGKTQLLNEIEARIPADFNTNDNITYIEPFVGGGAVLFWILQKYPNIKHAIINDVNPKLITTYQTIKDNVEDLIKELHSIEQEYLPMKYEDRKVYYLAKRDLFNSELATQLQIASLFIFLNRTCFNGLYRVNSKGMFNVPFGRYNHPTICDEYTLRQDSKLLQKVTILNGDYAETAKHVAPNTFVYFDPPYRPLSETSSFTSYAEGDFNDAEQVRLKFFADNMVAAGCKVLLSNSDPRGKDTNDMFFDELYASYIIERVYATRMVNANAAKRGRVTEIMVRSYNKTANHQYSKYKVALRQTHILKNISMSSCRNCQKRMQH